MIRRRAGALGLAGIVVATSGGVSAQQLLVPGDTVMTRPARQYPAGTVQRWLLGDGYRDLWSLDIPVEVLDLSAYAGGLEPLRLGGGQQTQSIRFRGGDGLVYNFRSVDKDARRGLDPQLRKSLAADVMQDQISSLMPLSAMIVAELLDAVGLFHPQPRLVVMPDDPRLGEYREAFAGVLGWIELRPDEGEDDTPGFAGSERVVGSDRLYERLENEPDNLVDGRAYLKARYIDFLVGDWDRHPDQWRWAGFPDTIGARDVTLFQPVPRDRDWALARLDGLIQTVASLPYPQYVGFSRDFPDPFAASWNGRGLDRRLLSQLDSTDFAEVAREVHSALGRDVIEAAVTKLPAPYYAAVGATIEASLEHRRDGLPDFAERYYDLLARWVDVDATDDGELVEIERLDGGSTRLTIFDLQDGIPRSEPYFRRTFRPSHTDEIRVYAHGGDDRIEISGVEGAPIEVRIVGGGGDDTVDDRTDGSGVHVYDHRGDNRFDLGSSATLDTSEWDAPEDPAAEQHGARSRDWGSAWLPLPAVSFDPDNGLAVGVTASRLGFGFRRHPWAERLGLSVSISTATWRPNVGIEYESRTGDPRLRTRSRIRWIGSRTDRFYGFGNSSSAAGDDDLFRARRSELLLSASLVVDAAPGLSLSIGPGFRSFRPEANEGTVIAAADPYGYGNFEYVDAVAELELDRRDDPRRPRAGAHLIVRAAASPAVLDVEAPFGWVDAIAATYLSSDELPLSPTLALRVQGRRTLGDYPYFAAASLGGGQNLRGFRDDRFLGDTSLSTSVELRGTLDRFFVLFPGRVGLIALMDTGRVWFDGESSSTWHTGVGGGVWVTLVEEYTASVVYARGDQNTLYLTLGLPF